MSFLRGAISKKGLRPRLKEFRIYVSEKVEEQGEYIITKAERGVCFREGKRLIS